MATIFQKLPVLPKNINNSGVYIISSKIDGKIYIGSAHNFRIRWSEHRRDLKRGVHDNTHLQNIYDKYGERNLEYHITEYVSKELCLKREQEYLDMCLINGEFPKNKIINIAKNATAPRLGIKMSEETKRKIGEANKGKKHSRETIDKLIKFRRENKEELRKIYIEARGKELKLQSPTGEIVTIKGIANFCEENRLDISALYRVLKGKSLQHHGWMLPPNFKKDVYHLVSPYGSYFEVRNEDILCFAGDNKLNINKLSFLCDDGNKILDGWSLNGNLERITLVSPNGVKYSIPKIYSNTFAKTFGLAEDLLKKLIRGKSNTCLGWSRGDSVIKIYKLLSPSGQIFEIKRGGLGVFCKSNNLTISVIYKLIYGKRSHHKNWRIIK